jgi:hypothetical protein
VATVTVTVTDPHLLAANAAPVSGAAFVMSGPVSYPARTGTVRRREELVLDRGETHGLADRHD